MKAQSHRIAVPAILEVGENKLQGIGKYLSKAGIAKVSMFFGEGMRQMFGASILESIAQNKNVEVLETYDYDDVRIENIIQAAFNIPTETEAVLGVGGGKVLDVAKYAAFLRDVPFVSVPTSTSHDGFASSGCSLMIEGKRTSVHAKSPYGIIVDTGVIKNSPKKFILSGIGDIVSKITAAYDWQFEEANGKAVVDDFAVMIAKKSVNSIVRISFDSILDNFFINELVDSLTMSGIAMEIAGSSAPASGSEHLISHALDKITETPELHGIQVGVATYIMSKVQNHRFERVATFLTKTGFFEFVGTLGLKADEFIRAVDLAPKIKPNRYTYMHVPEYRETAKEIILGDPLLKSILK